MLCSTLHDPTRPGNLRYIAAPKFDGQRAQGPHSGRLDGRGLQPASTVALGVGLSSRTLHASGGARPINSHRDDDLRHLACAPATAHDGEPRVILRESACTRLGMTAA